MRSGFVALVGRPNVGKSSLLNKLVDYQLAIVSPTAQTTRDAIKAFYNSDRGQIVFIDTPGLHKPVKKVGEFYNQKSAAAQKGADLVLFLQPLNDAIGPGDKRIIENLPLNKAVAVMTKLDLGNSDKAAAKAAALKKLGFKDVIGVSTHMQASIDHLIDYIYQQLPEQPPFYSPEDITDVPVKFIAKEIIRESVINFTSEEVPHSVGVLINSFDENDNDITIDANIIVERNSQKGILIGKNGAMIKKIGIKARSNLISALHTKVNLTLKVKVDKKWTNQEAKIKQMGY